MVNFKCFYSAGAKKRKGGVEERSGMFDLRDSINYVVHIEGLVIAGIAVENMSFTTPTPFRQLFCITQGIKPALAVDRAVELSLHHFNRLAIHL